MAEEKEAPARPASSKYRPKARAARAQRVPSPTRVIQVGTGHVRAAETILKITQRTAERKLGIKLDIGSLPAHEANELSDDDGSRLVELTAHAIARLADRLPFTRRLSRHMEGTDNKAGLLSDLLAICGELAKRNPDVASEQVQSFVNDLTQARHRKAQEKRTQATATTGGIQNAA